MKTKCQKYIILFLVLFSLFTRFFYYNLYPVPWRDSFYYVEVVNECIKNNSFPKHNVYDTENNLPPLPIVIPWKISMLFKTSIINVGVALSIVVSLLLIVIFWYVCKMLFHSVTISTITSLILSLHPVILDFSTQFSRDIYYIFFSTLLLFHLICFIQRHTCYFIVLLGFDSSMAFLCRYEAIEIFVMCTILLSFLSKGLLNKFANIILYCFFCVIFLMLFSIYIDCYPEYFLGCYNKFIFYYNQI